MKILLLISKQFVLIIRNRTEKLLKLIWTLILPAFKSMINGTENNDKFCC